MSIRSALRSTTARASRSSTPGTWATDVGLIPVRWFGTMPARRANQWLESCVRMAPLPGTGVGRTTSNAEIRSDASIRRCSPRS
jgi:hypothetical protein